MDGLDRRGGACGLVVVSAAVAVAVAVAVAMVAVRGIGSNRDRMGLAMLLLTTTMTTPTTTMMPMMTTMTARIWMSNVDVYLAVCLLPFLQIVSLLQGMGFDWPEMSAPFAVSKFFSININLAAPSCFGWLDEGDNFLAVWLVYMSVPWVSLGFNLVLYSLVVLLARISKSCAWVSRSRFRWVANKEKRSVYKDDCKNTVVYTFYATAIPCVWTCV